MSKQPHIPHHPAYRPQLSSTELDLLSVPRTRLATPEESLHASNNRGYYSKQFPDGSIMPAFHVERAMTTFSQQYRDRISKYPDVVILSIRERNQLYYKEMHHVQEPVSVIDRSTVSTSEQSPIRGDDGGGDGACH